MLDPFLDRGIDVSSGKRLTYEEGNGIFHEQSEEKGNPVSGLSAFFRKDEIEEGNTLSKHLLTFQSKGQ